MISVDKIKRIGICPDIVKVKKWKKYYFRNFPAVIQGFSDLHDNLFEYQIVSFKAYKKCTKKVNGHNIIVKPV